MAYSYNVILQGNERINDSYTQCLDKSHKDVEKINQTHTKIQYGSIYIKFNSTSISNIYKQTNTSSMPRYVIGLESTQTT